MTDPDTLMTLLRVLRGDPKLEQRPVVIIEEVVDHGDRWTKTELKRVTCESYSAALVMISGTEITYGPTNSVHNYVRARIEV